MFELVNMIQSVWLTCFFACDFLHIYNILSLNMMALKVFSTPPVEQIVQHVCVIFTLLLFNKSTLGSYLNSTIATNTTSSATMIFVGDMSFDGFVRHFAEKEKSCSYSALFVKVRELLMDADLRIGNLECPLLKPPFTAKPAALGKSIHHFGSTRAILGLKSAGFNIIQVANNHLLDYGTYGVKSTLDTLRKAGIDCIGLRQRSKRNQKALVKNINGIKIGFLSYCLNKEGCELFESDVDSKNSSYMFELGPSVFSKNIAREDISNLKQRVHIVVVMMHWSRELSLLPPLGIREIAQSTSAFGANLIIGTHPHVIQGHECTGRNALTIYSLGNFLFRRHGVKVANKFMGAKPIRKKDVKEYTRQMKEVFSATQFGYMFRISVTKKKIQSASYIPVEIRNEPKTNCLQPTPLTLKWQDACEKEDSYCIDFQDVYTSGEAGLKEELDSYQAKVKYCVDHNER